MESSKKVIYNTVAQYIKMIITVGITLYSTRLILSSLGISDFGIYSLVAGLIGMLSFLNGAMSSAVQRFLSFSIGAGDNNKLNVIYNTSIVLHILLAIIIVLLLEILGLYSFKYILDISKERIQIALIVFHLTVISTFFTVLGTPFNAVLIAKENLILDAVLSVIQSVFKLGAAIYLLYTGFDKLLVYGLLMAIIIIFNQGLIFIYVVNRCKEFKLKLFIYTNKAMFKEMLSFSKWMTFGTMLFVFKRQGLAFILNPFYGTSINAAYGISGQVNGQISFFSQTLLKAINPQIMQSEGAGNRKRMIQLSGIASKFSFYLLSLFTIPLVIELQLVLELWLKIIPNYTLMICGLILVSTLIRQLTSGLFGAIQAVGNIRSYELIINGLAILTLPVGYLILKAGLPLILVFLFMVLTEIVLCFLEILLAKSLVGLSIKDYLLNVVLKAILPVITSLFFGYLVHSLPIHVHLRLCMVVLTTSIILILSVWNFGLDMFERNIFLGIIKGLNLKLKQYLK